MNSFTQTHTKWNGKLPKSGLFKEERERFVPLCHHVPDHHIKLINPLAQRLVGEDSSVPNDDARLAVHTVTQKRTIRYDLLSRLLEEQHEVRLFADFNEWM